MRRHFPGVKGVPARWHHAFAHPGFAVVTGILSGIRRREEPVRRSAERRSCRECRATYVVNRYQVSGSRPLRGRRWHLCLDCDLTRRCEACGRSFKAPRNAQHQTTCGQACHEEKDRRLALQRHHARQAALEEQRRRRHAHPLGRIDARRLGPRRKASRPERL